MKHCRTRSFKTRMQGSVEAISSVVKEAMDFVGRSNCAAGLEFEVETALTEALANAVVHGCRQDAGQTVRLSVICDPRQGLEIVVRDAGSGFDPSAVANPLEAQNVRRPGGRGIFIMRQFMDEVRYRRGGREVQLRLCRPPGQPPDQGRLQTERETAQNQI